MKKYKVEYQKAFGTPKKEHQIFDDISEAKWFENFHIETKKNGLVVAREDQEYKFQTSNKKIFSGGDMVRGSDLVVTAIWEGREAGKSIIEYVS